MSNSPKSVFPLEGIRVLDLTRLIPGAFRTHSSETPALKLLKGRRPRQMITSVKFSLLLDQWIEELGELNICISPVNTLEEAISHP